MENEEQKDLPKPLTDLPLPRLQVPEHSDGGQAEKKISVHATPQGHALQNQKTNIFKSKFFIGFVLLSTLIAFIAGGFLLKDKNLNNQIACTQEAKQCPDGSYVSRTGPNCEFEKCPATTPTEIPNKTSQAFLEVAEFGIKFALSEDIKDAYVVTPKSGTKDYVYLKVHSLDNEPQCNSDESSTAALSKVEKDETSPVLGDKKYSETMNGFTMGNYFYYIDLAQYECAESPAGKAKLELVRKAFSNASSKITSL